MRAREINLIIGHAHFDLWFTDTGQTLRRQVYVSANCVWSLFSILRRYKISRAKNCHIAGRRERAGLEVAEDFGIKRSIPKTYGPRLVRLARLSVGDTTNVHAIVCFGQRLGRELQRG